MALELEHDIVSDLLSEGGSRLQYLHGEYRVDEIRYGSQCPSSNKSYMQLLSQESAVFRPPGLCGLVQKSIPSRLFSVS